MVWPPFVLFAVNVWMAEARRPYVHPLRGSPAWGYFTPPVLQRIPPLPPCSPMDAMVDLTNDLGVAILQDHSFSRANFAFSPYGLASVLVVLYEGARGESARQIRRAVRFPPDKDVMRVGFRDIHRHLRSYFSHEGFLSGITLNKKGSSLTPGYKQILRFYGYDVDPGKPTEEEEEEKEIPSSGLESNSTSSTVSTTTKIPDGTTPTTPGTLNATGEVFQGCQPGTEESSGDPTTTPAEKEEEEEGMSSTTAKREEEVMSTTKEPGTPVSENEGEGNVAEQSQTTTETLEEEKDKEKEQNKEKEKETETEESATDQIQTTTTPKEKEKEEENGGIGEEGVVTSTHTTPKDEEKEVEKEQNKDKEKETEEEESPTDLIQTTTAPKEEQEEKDKEKDKEAEKEGSVTGLIQTSTTPKEQEMEKEESTTDLIQTTTSKEEEKDKEQEMEKEESTTDLIQTTTSKEEEKETETEESATDQIQTTTTSKEEEKVKEQEMEKEESTTDLIQTTTSKEEEKETETEESATDQIQTTTTSKEEEKETETEESVTDQIQTTTISKEEEKDKEQEMEKEESATDQILTTTASKEEQEEKEKEAEESATDQIQTTATPKEEEKVEENGGGEEDAVNPTYTTPKDEAKEEEKEEEKEGVEDEKVEPTLSLEALELDEVVESTLSLESLELDETQRSQVTSGQRKAKPSLDNGMLIPQPDEEAKAKQTSKQKRAVPPCLVNQIKSNTKDSAAVSVRVRASVKSRRRRTIADYLRSQMRSQLSLQLQNGMYNTYVSRNEDMYRSLPRLPFLVDGAIDTPVPMMTYVNNFPFAYIPRLHSRALEFPLDDIRYKLLILLPVERRGLRQLIYDLSYCPLSHVLRSLRPARVKVTVPTFMVEGFVILTSSLQKLGIWDVFDPRKSNLSGMSIDPELYVRNVEQSVTVVIRNYVEILDIQTRTMAARNIERDFEATHPFLYFVLDTATNVALMAGQMLDPLNSRIY